MKNVGLGLVLGLAVVGCGGAYKSAPSSPGYSGGYPAAEPAMASPASVAPPASPADVAPPTPPAGVAKASPAKTEAKAAEAAAPLAPVAPAPHLPQAGQLTAGVWDDNLNFEFFRPYAARESEKGRDHELFGEREIDAARSRALAPRGPRADLDVQLVLDTTGSMGDELSYLQSEFDSIAGQIRTKFPGVVPRYSLVVYRDHGDEYLTRAFDFTSDTGRFRENLRAQSAGGGGDTPEAVVEGLSKGLDQGWRTADSVAKVAFWVADAPAHPGEGVKLARVIRAAVQKGVHIYPIASSDTDDTAEYQMRSAAQMTGGRYVFLTDDSGVGNAHAEPHIPCYNVSRLDRAIVRMISVELSGRYVESDPRDVVRSVGAPDKEGKCRLPSGMLVASY